jgi:transcription elongation factor Elf1
VDRVISVLSTVSFFVMVKLIMVDLSAPIDVYSDWIDAAEAVGRGGGGGVGDEEYEEEGIEA